MIRRRALLATPVLALPAAVRAQAWPSRPVRIVVAYPPGGSTDVLARGLAAALQEAIPGSTFVVDNRPGGAAVVGTQAVAQAAADGYTLSLGNNQTHAANAAMLPSLPFDPVADFAPIARLAAVHHAIVVPANGARTLAELAAKGRDGGRVTYASSGAGSASHVIAETFVRRERMEATHVPYRGGAQATTDTVSGTVDFFVSTWPQVVALVRDGRLRALGIGAPARLPETPDVPTFAELNAQDLAVDAWFGLWAPARTPAEVVTRLSDALMGILAAPAMRERLNGQGFVAAPLPSDAFAAFQRDEVARWRRLVELTGIRLQG
ncbi:tripartite tricarboxylate transporter substrate binding protein [Roseomonas eburnea]|uniref:Tripartite tricarboxylate transporter substrate binding protein n=1 Tax=Neoroseomonas eburnea TaxID=1346889 RepID=A0A9X9X7S9_9PROT|nr:tripartite tricarboxylate transporter substrate binding protein [Neoroseomonas eburnea]MBR0679765.1 tripartite tricarboxylate transporter substrate binding protein [Neoroseomonas eburnea]